MHVLVMSAPLSSRLRLHYFLHRVPVHTLNTPYPAPYQGRVTSVVKRKVPGSPKEKVIRYIAYYIKVGFRRFSWTEKKSSKDQPRPVTAGHNRFLTCDLRKFRR